MTDSPSPRRRTFGPVVGIGVISGVAAAMAGAEPWFVPTGSVDAPDGVVVGATYTYDVGVVTSANALALAGLACWGVVLVSRGRFRQLVAVIGLLTALGVAATVVGAFLTTPDDVRQQFEDLAVPAPEIQSTGWFWVGAVVAVLCLMAWVAAVRFVRHWPEMGRRYDTPADSPPEDLWKAIDAGHDPTS
ncbi:Trp biosynthesis-associated membrane protein [Nocardioides dilutus]